MTRQSGNIQDAVKCLDLLAELSDDLFKIGKAGESAADDSHPQRIDKHDANHVFSSKLQVAMTSAHDLLGRSWLDQGRYEEAKAVVMNDAVRLSSRSWWSNSPIIPPYRESRAASQIYLAQRLRDSWAGSTKKLRPIGKLRRDMAPAAVRGPCPVSRCSRRVWRSPGWTTGIFSFQDGTCVGEARHD